jgi:hypothetical protein
MFCFVYAQGLPLIICAITAIIDATGKGKPSSKLQFYPEMGVYSCFLGSEKTSARKSYFSSPAFIYHQSVIILVQISNLIFLVLTGRQVCRPGDVPDNEDRNKGRNLQHFYLFVKLFFILGNQNYYRIFYYFLYQVSIGLQSYFQQLLQKNMGLMKLFMFVFFWTL